MIAAIGLAVLGLAIGAAILVASALSRPAKGCHRTAPARFADPAAPDGTGWPARIRPAHLPRAGCLITSDLLEDPWNLAAQVRPADPRPPSRLARGLAGTEVMHAADTGELLATGRITPADLADRLDRQHFGGGQ